MDPIAPHPSIYISNHPSMSPKVRQDRTKLVSELGALIQEDSKRGMATDSVDRSVGIMECMTRIKRNLNSERQVEALIRG